MTAARIDQVRDAFDRPERYLKHDAPIDVRARVVGELLQPGAGCRILDVGCGDGRISLQFLSDTTSVTLLDLSPRMLEAAAARVPPGLRGRVECVNAGLEDYAPRTPFDVVLCVGVLAHVASVPLALRRVAALTAPGGACVLQLTDHDRILGRLHDGISDLRRRLDPSRSYPVNRIRLDELVALAAEHGFVGADARRYWGTFPGMGLLPRDLGLWLIELSRRHAVLSRRGAEVLVLFRKK